MSHTVYTRLKLGSLNTFIRPTFRVSLCSLQWPRPSVCVSVCVSNMSLAAYPHYCTDPDVTWGIVGGALQLCTIGRICNRCTGFVAMTTQHRTRNVSECSVLALCLVPYVMLSAVAHTCSYSHIATEENSTTTAAAAAARRLYMRRISRRRDAIVLATDVTGKMYTEQSSSQRSTRSLHRAASSTLSAAAAETANSATLVLTEVAKRTLHGADHRKISRR